MTCHDMKLNEIYFCGDCGLELKVVKACSHEGCEDDDCDCCGDDGENCAIFCCGEPLQKKA